MINLRILILAYLSLAFIYISDAHAGLTDGLIGHWRLDEKSGSIAKDSTSFGNDGAYMSEPIPIENVPDVQFNNPRSLNFDGVDDFVDLGKRNIFDVQKSASAFAFVNINVLTQNKYIFADFNVGGAHSQGSIRYLTSLGQPRFSYYQNHTDGTSLHINNIPIANSTVIVTNRWYHFGFVRDDTKKTVTLYVDGEVYTVGSYDGKIVRAFSDVGNRAIGRSGDFVGDYVNGKIDDVRYYNRALTEREVQFLAAGYEDVGSAFQEDLGPQFSQGKAVVGKVFFDWNGNGKQDYFGPPSLELRRGSSRVAREDFDGDGRQDAGGIS